MTPHNKGNLLNIKIFKNTNKKIQIHNNKNLLKEGEVEKPKIMKMMTWIKLIRIKSLKNKSKKIKIIKNKNKSWRKYSLKQIN